MAERDTYITRNLPNSFSEQLPPAMPASSEVAQRLANSWPKGFEQVAREPRIDWGQIKPTLGQLGQFWPNVGGSWRPAFVRHSKIASWSLFHCVCFEASAAGSIVGDMFGSSSPPPFLGEL